jgi:lipopolysaccharide export system permease protein
MEIQRRFALPAACLVLGLVAVPLGAASRLERGTGVAFGLGVFLLYYLLLTAAWSASEAGSLPSWSVWGPDVAVGALAAFLLRRANAHGGGRR